MQPLTTAHETPHHRPALAGLAGIASAQAAVSGGSPKAFSSQGGQPADVLLSSGPVTFTGLSSADIPLVRQASTQVDRS